MMFIMFVLGNIHIMTNKQENNNTHNKDDKGCLGYRDFNGDYDCGYETSINCDDCTFVVRQYTNDNRTGKRPWAKSNS